jgi:hypothetical protein
MQLAEELFDELNLSYLPHNYSNVPQPTSSFRFDQLRKAILLDLPTAVRIFRARLQGLPPLDRQTVEAALLGSGNACRLDSATLYGRFLNEVQTSSN